MAPRYWPAWLGLGCLYALGRLPWAIRNALGNTVGWLLYRVLRTRTQVARTNLMWCFPDLSPSEREAMVRRNARSMGAMVLELPKAWWSDAGLLRSNCRVDGIEHLEAARADNVGVLLVSVHFTTMDMAGRLLGMHVDRAAGLYRPHKNKAVEYALHRARTRELERIIPRRDIRGAIEFLRSGGVLWYAPDQDYKGVDTEFVSFFDVATSTITSTQKLARAGRAKVLPYWLERHRANAGYTMHFGPPLEEFPSGDRVADTQQVSSTVEHMIRQWPDHYLWIHQRFKTRPEGESSPY